MSGWATLLNAQRRKNDEFYTRLIDIETEFSAYDADLFRGKTVLCPCDDPEWSNFARYFVERFAVLGLRKLIVTSVGPDTLVWGYPRQLDLFGGDPPPVGALSARGRVFVMESAGDAQNLDNWQYLNGNGDFRSPEVTAFRDEADFVFTNPPFSLFSEFVEWCVAGGVEFCVVGNVNAVAYVFVFPLIASGRIKVVSNAIGEFHLASGGTLKFGNVRWFTTLPRRRWFRGLLLETATWNVESGKCKSIREFGYRRYENFDAIEVPFVSVVPSDYCGVMGVPVTFVDFVDPELFELVGLAVRGLCPSGLMLPHPIGHSNPLVDGRKLFKRLLIKHRHVV